MTLHRSVHASVYVALILGAGVPPAPSAAQVVVGAVVEEGTGQPLSAAFVLLEAEGGERGNGVLTGPDGRFVLRSAAPGRYRLVVEMLGYASTRTAAFELGAGATVERRIEMPVEAVSLEGIRVEATERCRRGPGDAGATARLWEEARKALELARWSMREGVLRFQLTEYEREVDARTLAVRSQTARPRSVQRNESPYRSPPAERLAAEGYVVARADGTYAYYLPDAEALLSDAFLDTHCFSVAEAPRGEAELVGLAFEPVPERTLPDVRGVLWLDRATAELRRVDVTYENVPGARRDWEQVGGRIEFERLSTGMWVVRRWRIRMPMAMAEVQRGPFAGAAMELVSLREQGAEVQRVRTAGGALLAEAAGGTLHGAVTAAREPLAGATVEIPALERRTTTRADGTYRLPGLPAGAWEVRFDHPALGLLGLEPGRRTVEVREGRAAPLSFDAGLTPELAAELCRTWGAEDDELLVYGRITGPDGAAVGGGILRLLAGSTERRITADSAGAFRLCLPADTPVRLAAVSESGVLASFDALPSTAVPAGTRGFHRADLVLATTPRAAAVTDGRRWANAILGRTVDAATGEPVAGVTLSLRDDAGAVIAGAVTGDGGAFRIPHPGGGEARFTLAAEHVGYGPVSAEITFPQGEQLRLDVQLAARALALEPIVVRERRRGLLVDVGYYERRESGLGEAIDRAEIERRVPSRVTDLLSGMPGVRVVPMDLSATIWDVRFAGTTGIGRSACQPTIWVDGNLVRPGGTPQFDPVSGRYVQLPLSDAANPAAIEAIEVFRHPGEVPARYRTDAACGVVLIWTRQG